MKVNVINFEHDVKHEKLLLTMIFYMIYLKVWNIEPKGESFAKLGFIKI